MAAWMPRHPPEPIRHPQGMGRARAPPVTEWPTGVGSKGEEGGTIGGCFVADIARRCFLSLTVTGMIVEGTRCVGDAV